MTWYDYGKRKNSELYGSEEAPVVDLTAIGVDIPIAMFSGNYDMLCEFKDVLWLYDQINKDAVVHFELKDYGHESYFIGQDMSFWDRAMEIINIY